MGKSAILPGQGRVNLLIKIYVELKTVCVLISRSRNVLKLLEFLLSVYNYFIARFVIMM